MTDRGVYAAIASQVHLSSDYLIILRVLRAFVVNPPAFAGERENSRHAA